MSSPDIEITEVEQEEERGSWRVRWEFPPSTGQVTFVLDYEMRHALREVKETNEVFWRVVGDDWDVPFRQVEAEISIPTSFSLSSADLTLDPPDISSVGTEEGELVARFVPGPLPAGRAYQVKVSFPRVIAGRAVGLARTENQALLAGILSLAFFPMFGGIAAFLRLGPRFPRQASDPRGRGSAPRQRFSCIESPRAWDRVFPATLFDLADRGVISLERVDRKKRFFTSQKVLLHRNDESDEVLTPFESAFLTELGGVRRSGGLRDQGGEVQKTGDEEGSSCSGRKRIPDGPPKRDPADWYCSLSPWGFWPSPAWWRASS